MENTENLRNEALTAIYKMIKTKAEDTEMTHSLANAEAISTLSHACSQLESINDTKASARALMDLHKTLDSYKDIGFNGMVGYSLNKDN